MKEIAKIPLKLKPMTGNFLLDRELVLGDRAVEKVSYKGTIGGFRPTSGRKPELKKLIDAKIEHDLEMLKAEFWANLAKERGIPRLIDILKKEPTKSPNLLRAIQEVLNRALGKPTEKMEITEVRLSLDVWRN